MNEYDFNSRYGRLVGLIDVRALAPKRVTIIGAGSMGQPISIQLARHGVATKAPGRIRLIDGDVVAKRNLIGTDYRLVHVGRPKAEAAVSIINEINPDTNISYWNHMVTDDDIPQIVTFARQTDLLCLFADSFELMLEISKNCTDICPQIMAVFGPSADYAEIAFSLPRSTPSLEKTMGQRKRKTISKPTALGCDTAFVASFVAAICIRILLGKAKGHDLIPCYVNAPLLLVGLRRSWIFKNQPQDIIRVIVYVQAK